jgi:hypothetical protein
LKKRKREKEREIKDEEINKQKIIGVQDGTH